MRHRTTATFCSLVAPQWSSHSRTNCHRSTARTVEHGVEKVWNFHRMSGIWKAVELCMISSAMRPRVICLIFPPKVNYHLWPELVWKFNYISYWELFQLATADWNHHLIPLKALRRHTPKIMMENTTDFFLTRPIHRHLHTLVSEMDDDDDAILC